jgi:arginyl-tRNA synthetase
MIIEYGQPNTHKEVHVGHLRNFFLGLAMVRLARAAGNEVVPTSYIGDVGTHVAKCLWAYKKFHDGERPEKGEEGKFLGSIYTEASQKIEEDESLKEEVYEVQRALEAGDEEWNALWKETRQWSLDEMNTIFSELSCEFDRVYFESEVEGPGKELVKELLDKGVAKMSQGAIVMDYESEGLGVFLMLKTDGSSLYATKELALARLKFEEYPDTDVSTHVVDVRQSLYFKQFFRTLEVMGFDKRMVHLSYDFVTLKEGAMSSRKGNVITYGEFRDEMVRRTAEETRGRHEDWSEEQVRETSWKIAEAAMKFSMLKQDNDRPIVFDIDSALSFDGFTGPYVQYAHARMNSILAKAEDLGSVGAEEYSGFTKEEFDVLRKVAALPDMVGEAARDFRPSVVAQYAFELAQDASAFYRDVPVLNADPVDRDRRLSIVRSVRTALARALDLLGIQAPDEM